MACRAEYDWIVSHKELLQGPVLEVGSKRYRHSRDYRPLFSVRDKYIGVDQEAGEGVDWVCDLTDVDGKHLYYPAHLYQTILCLSVLEHCRAPWLAAKNLVTLLAPGGILFVSVPFAWRLHAYPEDYWRMTPAGIRALFPDLDWDRYPGCLLRCRGLMGKRRGLQFLRRYSTGQYVRPILIEMIGVNPG